MTSKIAHSTANASTEETRDKAAPASRHTGSPIEVLIAHISYFREEFVIRRKWLDEQA